MKRILLASFVLFSGTLSALAQSENLLATFEVGNNDKELKIVLGSISRLTRPCTAAIC